MDGGTDGPIIIVGWRQTVEMVGTFTQSHAITRLPAQSHYVLHRKQVARKALELLAKGVWAGKGVLAPENFDARPFLELLASPEGFSQPWEAQDRDPANPALLPTS